MRTNGQHTALHCSSRVLQRGEIREEEALKHIHEVVQMVVQTLLEDGEPIPEDVLVSQEPLVSITI